MPIDPCNNCPAPVYNRPKICMGKTQKTPEKDEVKEPTWTSQTGIRKLAKFYDSIPDYCEVKHLHQAEFYSTLETLRSTSRELRASAPAQGHEPGPSAAPDRCSSAKKRLGKGKKKKHCPPLLLPPATSMPTPLPTPSSTSCSLSDEYEKCLKDLSRLKSFKQEFAVEVEDFKQSLKNFEEEFRRPKSTSSTQTNVQPKPAAPPPTRLKAPLAAPKHTAERSKCRMEMLRRCFSSNDLATIASLEPLKSDAFPPKEVPKIQIDAASVSSKRTSSAASSCNRGRGRGRARRAFRMKITSEEKSKPPTAAALNIFDLDEQLAKTTGTCSISPQHPVARPNLAATLRAEVSRKKVKELRNQNCTYHEPRPSFDWEVRKTPAWKSLSLNESHKALLSIRLATRKAEQALQERQYDLHMEMMRQRVKSAPLLLEGPTYWGPEVGKLSHNCRSEGLSHNCDSSKHQKIKKQKSKCISDADAKLQQLRKIYGTDKSCQSRQSTQRSKRSRSAASHRHVREENPMTPINVACTFSNSHDSGDDLCSVDRAFL
ncbi:uncharacterized protein [Drosophila tropicalis]|uniref:uncharacterized protein n=1 Tax=Drosophila tropicalis TaxID=46794 RepID=UPI0035ABD428